MAKKACDGVVKFRVVTDWAGVAWNRSSSLLDGFGEARRMAKEAAGDGRKRRARVYAVCSAHPSGFGSLVAEYHPGPGGEAVAVPVE